MTPTSPCPHACIRGASSEARSGFSRWWQAGEIPLRWRRPSPRVIFVPDRVEQRAELSLMHGVEAWAGRAQEYRAVRRDEDHGEDHYLPTPARRGGVAP